MSRYSRPYSELNKLPPEAFLNPEDFRTGYDSWETNALYGQKQYEKGLKVSNESARVGISESGTWWAAGKDGSFTSSYEGVGYHTATADLLRGLLEGSAAFYVYRWDGEKSTCTCIKPAKV